MLNAFWWFVTAEAIGLAAFPIAYFLLPRLADRGYSISKPLGLLFIGYASWMLGLLHIAPSIRITLILLLLGMGSISAWYVWRNFQEIKGFVVRERKVLIISEIVFLAFFVGWAIFRAYDPFINHTEQPMDMAFLNASILTQFGQPEDPWLRGETVSYYYFGYWIMGSLSQITNIPSNISFNLSLVLVPAMAAMGIFGIVFNMIRTEAARWGYAVVGGVAASIFMGIAANLEGVLEFMRSNGMGSQGFWDWLRIDGLDGPSAVLAESWTPQDFWWWFRSTRVINTFQDGNGLDYTIQEFPYFSFILGDLHPHVMAIPFGILFMGMALNFMRSPIHVWVQRNIQSYASLLVMGFVLGGIAFINMWDFPTFATLFVGVAGLKSYRERNGNLGMLVKDVLPVAVLILAIAFIMYAPYFFGFRAGIKGIGAVATPTRTIHMLIIWGLFLAAVVPFVLATFWQTTVSQGWRRIAVAGLVIAFLPWVLWVGANALFSQQEGGQTIARFLRLLPFEILIAIAVYNALWLSKREGLRGKTFAMALSALGLMLIMGPEILFIRDSFESRMNTVFKLYYQAWVILAVVSGFAIYYWHTSRKNLSGWRRSLSTLWAGVFIALFLGSLYYPAAAAVTKGDLGGKDPTLDGLVFARDAEYEAIMYLKDNAPPNSAMVEGVGEWFDWGLISRSTGIPTIFNWRGHELQWRGGIEKFDGRESDILLIYQTQSPDEAKNLLDKYDVDYVYISNRERDKYGEDGLQKFDEFMDVVFNQDDVIIYRLKQ